MSIPTHIAQTTLDMVLAHLTPLFLIGSPKDPAAARTAATEMLGAYQPETEDELTLAAETISLRLHTLEALSHAASPDLPLNKVLRLRGSAVSLSRESHKSQQKLNDLQRDRRAGIPTRPHPPEITPKVEKALALIETARDAIQIAQKGQSWSKALQQRLNAKRIADNFKKNQAKHAAATAKTSETGHPTA